ncbi:Protein of unknown function, partial [Gryllus bimaculatus]
MFLRRRLGMGYRLVLDGESSTSGTERGTQKPQHVTQAQIDSRSTDSATSTVGDKAESTGKTGTTFLRPPDPSKFRENQRASLKTGLPAIWGRTSILQLYLRQLRALLLKRFHHTRRSPKVLFSQVNSQSAGIVD